MPKKARILLVGGGSGGHIIPNLAVASVIKAKNPQAELLYVASRNGLDAKLLATSNLKTEFIFSGKLRRYFSWQNFVDPFLIFLGFWQSFFIILSFRPHVIFSKGGYVSLPIVLAGFVLRRKIILHESDSRMGLANRISARLAHKVCVAFPEMAKQNKKYVFTGNPIRHDILEGNAKKGYQFTHFKGQLPVLLVWGGSQGAQQINELLMNDIERFTEHFQVIHITGSGQRSAVSGQPKNLPAPSSQLPAHKNYVSFEYIGEELKHIYAITDIVIGRAGANSLFELALLQKPNIIIPLANADQLRNADYFEKKGAGLAYKADLNLFDLTLNLWQNESLKTKMKKALKTLAKPEAAEEIADLILSL